MIRLDCSSSVGGLLGPLSNFIIIIFLTLGFQLGPHQLLLRMSYFSDGNFDVSHPVALPFHLCQSDLEIALN